MPYASPFYRVTFHHTVTGYDETAETGLTVAGLPGGPALPALSPPDLTALDDAYKTLMSDALLTQWASWSVYRYVKVARCDVNGDYTSDPQILEGASLAGTGSLVLPQATTVLSLRSGSSIGKGNYGRMYLPHRGLPASNDPRLTQPVAEGNALVGAAFIAEVNGIFDDGVTNTVVRIMGQGSEGPTNKPVSVVGCGRVVDTQRRRRRGLEEGYEFAPVA